MNRLGHAERLASSPRNCASAASGAWEGTPVANYARAWADGLSGGVSTAVRSGADGATPAWSPRTPCLTSRPRSALNWRRYRDRGILLASHGDILQDRVISPAQWSQLISGLPARCSPRADWGERNGMLASAWAWNRIAGGEHLFAPAVLAGLAAPRSQRPGAPAIHRPLLAPPRGSDHRPARRAPAPPQRLRRPDGSTHRLESP